jgi:hypothetical protein
VTRLDWWTGHVGPWIPRARAPSVRMFSGRGATFVVALLLLATTDSQRASAAVGAAPDPVPQPASAIASPTGPAPDPRPQAAPLSTPVRSPVSSGPAQTALPVAPSAGTVGAGVKPVQPIVSRPAAAAITPATRGSTSPIRSTATARPSRLHRVPPRQSSAVRSRGRISVSGRPQDLVDLAAAAVSSPAASRPNGAFLLLGALALTILVIASSSLLRLLVRMNAEMSDRWAR